MPRKYVTSARRRWRRKTCFNEAGADAPEIPAGVATALKSALASMRPGRMPRKYLAGFDASQVPEQASMRPGRMPRKYHLSSLKDVRLSARFNEAGADAPEIR